MPRLGEALANSWLALHSSKESQYEASVDEIRESLCALSTVNKSCLPETNESMTVESAALLARHTALRWPTQSFATFSKDIVGVDEDVPPSRPLQSMFPRVPSNRDPQPSEDLPSPRYADAPSGTSTPGPNSGTDLEQTPSKGAIANRDKCYSDKKFTIFRERPRVKLPAKHTQADAVEQTPSPGGRCVVSAWPTTTLLAGKPTSESTSKDPLTFTSPYTPLLPDCMDPAPRSDKWQVAEPLHMQQCLTQHGLQLLQNKHPYTAIPDLLQVVRLASVRTLHGKMSQTQPIS